MGKRFSKLYLRTFKWKYNDFPDVDKAVVLMAPHTSMWDFVLGKIYFSAQGRQATILIKKEAFFWPVGYFLKKMGGIPVDSRITSYNVCYTKLLRLLFRMIQLLSQPNLCVCLYQPEFRPFF